MALKQKLKVLYGCLLIGNGLAMVDIGYHYNLRERELQLSLQHSLDSMSHAVSDRVGRSVKMLHNLAPHLIAAHGDLSRIRDLINSQVTQAGGDLRIAWTDQDKLLRVGTLIGILEGTSTNKSIRNRPIDLSHRDYVGYASTHPGSITISAIQAHAITGRSFFAVALGVADEQQHYLGCIASIIDVENMRELFAQSLHETGFYAEVRMPNHQLLFASGNMAQAYQTLSTTIAGGFALTVAIPAHAQRALWIATLQSLCFTLTWINLILLGIYAAYSKLFIVPFERVSAYFASVPNDRLNFTLAGATPAETLAQKALAVTTLLQEHITNKEQTALYLQRLHEAVTLIHTIHDEQTSFLNSTSMEMEQAFQALSKYTDFVEGKISEEYVHEDEVFLEDVKDITLNLKYLANASYQIALHKTGQLALSAEAIDVTACLQQALAILQESFEWRNIGIVFDTSQSMLLTQYDQSVRHMLWGALYLAYKYVEDGADLILTLKRQNNSVQLLLHATHIRDQLSPKAERDIAEFLPNRAKQWKTKLQQQLDTHVNAVIVRYFAQHFGGNLSIDITEQANAYGFTICLALNELRLP